MPGISHAATALRDPLAIVLALFILGGLASHLLFRKYPVGRAAVRVVFLILLTVAFVHAGIVPYHPTRLTGNTLHDAVHGVLKIAWWLWAAWFLVALVRALIVSERRPHQDKLIQDLLAGVIYLAAVFAIIAYVLDLPVRGLLATSGAIAIVLGLALQSTLSDLFSGIVLDMCRPYRPGDWISIEGGTDGRVIETNWRATHVLTAKRDLAIVPNSTIAKAKIINVSSPSGIHGVTVTIQLESDAPPSSGKEILEDAVLNCRLIVRSPAPTVTIKSMNGAFTEFDIAFFVEDLAQSANAQNKLFEARDHQHAADAHTADPMLSLHRSIAGASALARRHPKIIGNRPTAATAAANRLASASHHQARATFQPTGRFFLPRLRPPATVEIPIGPSHYPPSPSSQTRSFNRACAPVTGAQTLIRF